MNGCLTYFSTLGGLGISVPLDKGLPYEELKNSLIRSYSDVLVYDRDHKELVEQLKADNLTQVKGIYPWKRFYRL